MRSLYWCWQWSSFINILLLYEIQEHMVTEKKETRPVTMNAFELISMSQGLNLSGLFESKEVIINCC